MHRMLITRIGAIAVTVLVGLAHPPGALAQDLGRVYVVPDRPFPYSTA